GVGRARRLAHAFDRRRGEAAAAARDDARPEGVPLRLRPPSTLEATRGRAARRERRRGRRPTRLRAPRGDEGPVRRELELARTGLVPDQLPPPRCAPHLPPLPR